MTLPVRSRFAVAPLFAAFVLASSVPAHAAPKSSRAEKPAPAPATPAAEGDAPPPSTGNAEAPASETPSPTEESPASGETATVAPQPAQPEPETIEEPSPGWPAPPAYDAGAAKLPLPSYEPPGPEAGRVETRYTRRSQGKYIAGWVLTGVGVIVALPVGIPILVKGIKGEEGKLIGAGAGLLAAGLLVMIPLGTSIGFGKANAIDRAEPKAGIAGIGLGPRGVSIQGRF